MDDLTQEDGDALFAEQRYAEAAEAFRRSLTQKLPAGLEADTRRRLADALDVLGQSVEATEERARAGAVAAGTPGDPQALIAWADLRKREGRYDEACNAYAEALRLMPVPLRLFFLPPRTAPERALVMAKLALAHHSAGRPGETVRWAKAALAAGPEPRTKLSMLRMAGVGLMNGGKLEQSGKYYQEALAWAEAMNWPADIAQNLTLLAGLEYKQGRFEEAIAACRRAAQIAPIANGLDLTLESRCLHEMGHFEEARAVIRQSLGVPTSDKPWVERRMRAVRTLGLAWLEVAAENPEAARIALDEARAGLKAESPVGVWPPPPDAEEGRLTLWCDATEAHVQAKSGRNDEAHRLMESVRARLTGFSTDQATLKTVYGQIGRAALHLGDLTESRRIWQSYLDCQAFPSALPTIHLHLGETLWRLGETDAAREAFRQAVAPGINSLDARRAQARLDESGG